MDNLPAWSRSAVGGQDKRWPAAEENLQSFLVYCHTFKSLKASFSSNPPGEELSLDLGKLLRIQLFQGPTQAAQKWFLPLGGTSHSWDGFLSSLHSSGSRRDRGLGGLAGWMSLNVFFKMSCYVDWETQQSIALG